jgi:hypothetical protein
VSPPQTAPGKAVNETDETDNAAQYPGSVLMTGSAVIDDGDTAYTRSGSAIWTRHTPSGTYGNEPAVPRSSPGWACVGSADQSWLYGLLGVL